MRVTEDSLERREKIEEEDGGGRRDKKRRDREERDKRARQCLLYTRVYKPLHSRPPIKEYNYRYIFIRGTDQVIDDAVIILQSC